ncbi:hypothetical protein CHS0354_042719 [Potamilus streckersoni]|uniref:Uncharacterized protein n=1 Tax=Potamilus streckersoni TaxID=2493646 RepID=A0AAE0VRC3_9BIVA|nr:hypothetical protein CHS0354_042719 [Potamilus streckersoni]
MEDLIIYSVTDLNSAPNALARRSSDVYYRHVEVPLPKHIVLFALGAFPSDDEEMTVTLNYKEDYINIGTLNAQSRCLCWEGRTGDIPDSMVSAKESGVAKLLVEKVRGSSSEESNNTKATKAPFKQEDDLRVLNETTPQVTCQDNTTLGKPTEQKRRSKGKEKTPNGPSAKKQKTKKTSLTRLKEPKETKENSETSFGLPNLENVDKENFHSNVPVKEDTEIKQQVVKKRDLQKAVPKKEMVAKCKDVTNRVCHPSSRWGHSLCFIHKNLAVLVGGQGDKQQLSKDSVWSLDPETRKWRCPDLRSEGQKSEYRMGHTATFDPMVRCIYMYGGSKNKKWFHDVHMLDIDEWKWQPVKVSGKAPTRAYHTATLYRHELWIFGGVYPRPDPQPDGCSNEIHIFSPVMESWYDPIIKGEKPVPRSGHSATLIRDQLVVFGGWDAPYCYNDIHILDMSIVEWSKPDVKGTPPAPRSWHASCALSGNRILIHGGYDGNLALDDAHIFNLDDMSWTHIKMDPLPVARTGHAALCMPYSHNNEEEDEVLVFGGGDNDGAFFDDFISINIPIKA